MKDRTIVVNGLSKGYAMTGWRLGYLAAPLEVVKACDKIQGQFTSATCSITQHAAIAALIGDQSPSLQMVGEFRKRRARVMEWMAQWPGVKCETPPGAFYVFPDISSYFGKKTPGGDVINTADDLCMYMLHHAHVSTVTGGAFGEPNCIRISFANKMETIEKGFAKIKQALESLT